MWRISEEGNTLGLDKKKTTYVGSASYYFLVLPFCADSISKEVAGFSPLCFPRGKLLVSLVSCDVLMFYCCAFYSLSEKILRS